MNTALRSSTWILIINLFILAFDSASGSERTKSIIQARKANSGHVGPPKRDAEVHGSLNPVEPSSSVVAHIMRQRCGQTASVHSGGTSWANSTHHAAPGGGELDLGAEATKLLERLARHSPDLGGVPALRRKVETLANLHPRTLQEADSLPPCVGSAPLAMLGCTQRRKDQRTGH